jgi:hypothetical protein
MIKQWIVLCSLTVSFSLQPLFAKDSFENDINSINKDEKKNANVVEKQIKDPKSAVPKAWK